MAKGLSEKQLAGLASEVSSLLGVAMLDGVFAHGDPALLGYGSVGVNKE